MNHHNIYFAFVIAIFFIFSGCAAKSPLIHASSRGDSLAVQKIINEGTYINEPDCRGYTPLMYAIWAGNTETVQLLINNGADINAKDEDGITPLMWASSYGYSDIVKIIIDRGADVNARDSNGYTSLLFASSYGHLDIARILIDRGANVNVRGKANSTPYSLARKTSGVSEASNSVPLNTQGIYSATADDGGTVYLYRYAPHTTETPAFRTNGTPVVIFTGIMVNMNQFLSCTPPDMKKAYDNVDVPSVSSAPAWTLNAEGTDYETYIKADKMRYYSLAHYLWLQGYDPWLVNYRDTGRAPIHSTGSNDRSLNTLDTWAALDVPAAIGRVKEVTGKRMFIGGHSTGGLVAYAYLQGVYLDYGGAATTWAKRSWYKSRFTLGYHPHVKSSIALAKTRNADIKGFIGIDPAGVPWLPRLLDSTIFWMFTGSEIFLPLDFISDKFLQLLPSMLISTSTDIIFGLINTVASDDVADPNIFNYMNFWLVEDMDPLMEDWLVRYGVSGASARSLGHYMDMGLNNTLREHYLNGKENDLGAKWIKGGPPPNAGNDGYYYYSENMSRMTVPLIIFSSSTGALVSPQATYEFIISKKSPTTYDQWYVVSGTAHIDIVMGKKTPTVVFPQLGTWLKTVDALPDNPINTTTPASRLDQ
jgi:hypothetical protein